ncbi:MAG TPA: AAA family ATPase, partial [Thermoleophilia bacterium]|nr:AAA family ATPase [Thermoleophilia bacterium]
EGFLTGDAVNVAARLQAAAPPMAVAVGEVTHAATERVFTFEACHPVALKGKREPLRAWIARAPLARTGAELRSFTTSFVGRKEELGALQDLLDEASDGRSPRFALIVGEPGIGKSRLLAEFARRLDEQSTVVNWRQGRCLPFGSGVTFWPLSEIVKACAGILESDGVARTEARLETVLPQGDDRDLMRARLRPLVGLEAEEASREENFTAWRRFVEQLALSGPTVLVVEDLHWADEGMLAFMDHLAGSDAEVPLLVLATSRPEVLELTGAGAGYVAGARRVALGPLSGDETAQLVLARLNTTSLPVGLQAKLLEASGGNPLFAEELVRLLEDRDLLEIRGGQKTLKEGAALPTPDSIGALIAARLDLLASERKALLGDAAVVGRTFWAGAVAAVGGRDLAEVYGGLHELVAKELVRPVRGSSIEGETEFLFVHALVRDVAYGLLTRTDRAAKHATFGRWLEQRTTGRTEDLAEILAYHYGTALEMAAACGLDELEDELVEPTGRYLALAGGRAAPLDAAASREHFARARRVAEDAQRPKRRWLLSRRTRRTIRRRAPLLVGAAAVIVVAAVAALGIWAFMPSKTPNPASAGTPGQETLTETQIAHRYGQSVVRITTDVPVVDGAALRWREVSVSGVVASTDGLIFTSGQPFMNFVIPYKEGGAAGGLPDRVWKRPPSWQPVFVDVEYFGDQGQYHKVRGVFLSVNGIAAGAVKIDTQGAKLQPVPLGDSEAVRNGDTVVTLYREGTFLARASGSISDYDYSDTGPQGLGQTVLDAMLTSATLPKPATGGALIDSHGRLVGVMGDLLVNGGQPFPPYSGPASAVGVSLFKEAVSNAQASNQQLPSAWLGVGFVTATADLGPTLDTDGGHGALVEFVTPGSPAEEAGIVGGGEVKTVGGEPHMVGGDVVVSVDGVAVRSAEDLVKLLGQFDPGQAVSVRLLRRPPGP